MSDFDKSHRLQLAVSLSALGLLAAGVWFSRRRSTGPSSENPNPSPTKSEPAPTTPVKRDDRGDVSPVSTRATPSGTAPERAPKYGNLVVNYFYQRRCNYGCKFCFHTEKSLPVSDIEQQLAGDCSSSNDAPRAAHLSLPDKKQALANLKEHDMIRVTFSGGEPFWSPLELGQLVDYCKCELRVEVSIVSNGSLIQERWMKKHGKNVDVLAISCDSFVPANIVAIGRVPKEVKSPQDFDGETHIKKMKQIRQWCEIYDIVFKINTTVVKQILEEDMAATIRELRPRRWKLFQCLLIDGENTGEDVNGKQALRDARDCVVSDEEYWNFFERHRLALHDCAVDNHLLEGAPECTIEMVAESNETMRNSYLLMDENLRFLDCRKGNKIPSSVTVLEDPARALEESGFQVEKFHARRGEWKGGEKAVFSGS